MKRTISLALSAIICAAVAQAAPALAKYENWAKSPEAYFLTSAEKAQWAQLGTNEAADAFISDFEAKRGGPAWVAEIEKRAAMADKYLSFGKVRGSETIGGKMLVLFGPPASVSVSDRTTKRHLNSSPGSPSGYVDGGSGSALEAPADGQTTGHTDMPGTLFRDFAFTFDGKSVPGLNRDKFETIVSVDTFNGKATLANRKQQAELEKIFESVAAASIQSQQQH
jgi:hypothetical protein